MSKSFLTDLESSSKNALNKKAIINTFIDQGDLPIAEIAKEMDMSVPTITKLLGELQDEGFVVDSGKQETNGGRRPSVYGLNPEACYFVGVDIRRFRVNVALTNFKGEVIKVKHDIPFLLENTPASLDQLCVIIQNFISKVGVPKEKIKNVAINISGRVNSESGYSYSFFYFDETPMSQKIEERIGCPVSVDNDSRAMAYGEYMCATNGEKNLLFVNVSWGLGLGMILNGQLYYGRSGFSGEFGHFHAADNEVLCHCGKKGCLETEASGQAIYRMIKEKIENGSTTSLEEKFRQNSVTMEDIVAATLHDDVLAIEMVEYVASTLGKHIAGLINIFNPELVVIGGGLSMVGDYLLLPLRSAIRKYSLNLVNKDTVVRLTKLGDDVGVMGACMLARSKMLNHI
ncbi:ROK family transcriptional regulator [Paludibacter sp.]|uniref:ROK family transcriptional regulator n=1 Tax=Paludibacter sp. TaxID=1898105 RepID=UPI00135292E9|nr:ROK family transcriptional regulator [Paludibacter sp.]MTK54637.1 ROK family transcriptional regulator [Paludibacter sp.]